MKNNTFWKRPDTTQVKDNCTSGHCGYRSIFSLFASDSGKWPCKNKWFCASYAALIKCNCFQFEPFKPCIDTLSIFRRETWGVPLPCTECYFNLGAKCPGLVLQVHAPSLAQPVLRMNDWRELRFLATKNKHSNSFIFNDLAVCCDV